jgi:hypothetical protein
MSDKAAAIQATITAMMAGIDQEGIDLYRNAASDPKVQEAATHARNHEIDQFYLALQFPFEQMVEAIVGTEVSNDANVKFLMTQSQFVEGHVEQLIKKYEGWACCADKSRTILSSLLHFFLTAKPITFDLNQEYTYHLPKKVLNNHDILVEFFDGLKFLYYGQPERYFKVMAKIMGAMVNEPPPKF